MKLAISYDNGQNWDTGLGIVRSTGAFKVPLSFYNGVASSVSRFRVTDSADATVFDISDAPYNIGYIPPGKIGGVHSSAGGAISVNWTGIAGRKVSLQYSSDSSEWTDVEEFIAEDKPLQRTAVFSAVADSKTLRLRIYNKTEKSVIDILNVR